MIWILVKDSLVALRGYFFLSAHNKEHMILTPPPLLIWGLFDHFSIRTEFWIVWTPLISVQILVLLENLSFDKILKFWNDL